MEGKEGRNPTSKPLSPAEPASPGESAAHGTARPTVPDQQIAATRRVLVMDDEPVMRELARHMFRRLGFEAECVAEGGGAVIAYRQAAERGAPFAAVFLDLTIRDGMGGEETARQLRALDPGARLVVTSGLVTCDVFTSPAEFGFAAALGKPFSLALLKSTLEAILSQPAAPGLSGE
jgi:two-component system, cell cycle sensor histidine kinase and response regulator CckA